VNELSFHTLGHGRCSYRVWITGEPALPPVALSIHTGAMSFQEYLTPEDAEQLVVLLAEAARIARDDEFARTAP
jgi:hypothetical protein